MVLFRTVLDQTKTQQPHSVINTKESPKKNAAKVIGRLQIFLRSGLWTPGSRNETIILGFADHSARYLWRFIKKGCETTAEYFTRLVYVLLAFTVL